VVHGPNCETPIEDSDKDIVFVTWGRSPVHRPECRRNVA